MEKNLFLFFFSFSFFDVKNGEMDLVRVYLFRRFNCTRCMRILFDNWRGINRGNFVSFFNFFFYFFFFFFRKIK